MKNRISAQRAHLTPKFVRNCEVPKQQQDWCVSGDFSRDYAKAYGGGNTISQSLSKFRNSWQQPQPMLRAVPRSGNEPPERQSKCGNVGPHPLPSLPKGQPGPFSLEEGRRASRTPLFTPALTPSLASTPAPPLYPRTIQSSPANYWRSQPERDGSLPLELTGQLVPLRAAIS